jgi:hypothetical protein
MAIVAKDVKFYLSGGASNANPKAALGGVISSHDDIAVDILGALFDDVTSGEATSGTTEYRCYYVKNTSADTWFSAEVWIQSDTSSANTALAIGLDPVGNGDGVSTGVATTIANETTAPVGVTFTAPTGSPGLSIGNLTAGQVRAVWVRRIVSAGAAAAAEDRAILRHSGTDV